jgi:hypothetical protein
VRIGRTALGGFDPDLPYFVSGDSVPASRPAFYFQEQRTPGRSQWRDATGKFTGGFSLFLRIPFKVDAARDCAWDVLNRLSCRVGRGYV